MRVRQYTQGLVPSRPGLWQSAGGFKMLDNLFTPTHLLIVLAIALLIFGPRKLPELGKGLGEGLRGFKEGIKGGPDAKQENTAAKTEAVTTPQTAPQTTTKV